MSDSNSSETNVNEFIGELNAGILVTQLGLTLSEAALAVIINGHGNKTAKVSLDLTLKQINGNDQVMVIAKLSKTMPTKTGKKSEENATDTPMFVGKRGILTIDQPTESLTGQFSLQSEIESRTGPVKSVRSIS